VPSKNLTVSVSLCFVPLLSPQPRNVSDNY
jgi:hypothetical protein